MPRTIILVFSALLLWALFRILRRTEGRGSAWVAVTALMATSAFQWQSVAVMIGLPAVALAVAALDQALVASIENKNWRFWLAGALYAVALQTKLFTGIIFPSLILATFLTKNTNRRQPLRAQLLKSAQLVSSLTLSFLAIGILADEPIVSQLINPHVNVHVADHWSGLGGFKLLLTYLWSEGSALVILIFGVGLLVCLRELTVARSIPALWLLLGTLALALHRPLWNHHVIILLVPVAWIAAVSIKGVHGANRWIAAAGLTGILLLVSVPFGAFTSGAKPYASSEPETSILRASSPDAWVIAAT